jgi:glycosyltransferase involved in cell wall biosynthesis
MAGEELLISVVVPAYNSAGTLAATLQALAAQDLETAYEVIVVDDGSTDETAQIAERAAPLVSLVRRSRDESRGAGAARNAGVTAARGRWLAFTDADCVPTRRWLGEGLAALARADFVQGAVAPDKSRKRMPFDHTVWVQHRSGLFETANLFVSRADFERVGGFEDISDTSTGRPFGEDAWLGWRLVRSGVSFEYCPDALVHHEVIPRGPLAFVDERRRRQRFPALVARIPELREQFFVRYFLSGRTFAFDLAVLTALVAAFSGFWPLAILTAPYLVMLVRGAIGWRRWAPQVFVVHLAADVVSLGALLFGSIRQRTLVL